MDGGRRRRARRRRSSTSRARPTGRTTGSGRRSSRSAITSLGLSPTLARALLPHGDPTHDLSSLRTFLTSGEPWNPEPYRWLYENVGRSRVPIINFSGGTEIAACFLSPVPSEPIKACSLGGPVLGMAMDIVDDDGRSLVGTRRGRRARLPQAVPRHDARLLARPRALPRDLLAPHPGRLGARRLGLAPTRDGFWFLHGRSDDTLNIAGKRIGPAELESAAVGHPAVREAAAVGVPHEVKGETAWIFCCLLPGLEPSAELDGRDRARRSQASSARRSRPVGS